MPRNVEIKARVDLAALQSLVEAIADDGPKELLQSDTFFGCRDGRLKLREFADGSAELIYYRRPDQSGPKESLFFVGAITDPETTKHILSASNGVLGVVKKRRLLYWIGQTRVHLDRVDGLGEFLELEVVLRGDQSTDEGTAIAHRLMETLHIQRDQLIEGAYLDLLHSPKV